LKHGTEAKKKSQRAGESVGDISEGKRGSGVEARGLRRSVEGAVEEKWRKEESLQRNNQETFKGSHGP